MPAPRPRLDLTGEWAFAADVGDARLKDVRRRLTRIRVPGCWQAQGYGMPDGELDMGSHRIQAAYLRHNLVARCLYVRDVTVPARWRGRRVWLVVRRVYRYADVEVNGRLLGQHEGFCTPFAVDITPACRFGQRNRIVIGVDTRARKGRDLWGVMNYAGNWGGIGGRVWLERRSPVWIEDVFAVPDVGREGVRLQVTVRSAVGALPRSFWLDARVAPWSPDGPRPPAGAASLAHIERAGERRREATLDLWVPLRAPRLWSPEAPHLYMATVMLQTGAASPDATTVRFGLRNIELRGEQLLLNGRPIYLCGYGDDSTEPATGIPPSDVELYRKRLRLMRRLGFNYVRHHSSVPHDEYLDAADEVGMLVQPEASVAYSVHMQRGSELFRAEWPRLIRAFRNHPCILNWCMGNEFRRSSLEAQMDIIREAYRVAKQLDPTRPVHTSDGGDVTDPTDMGDPRIQSGGTRKPARLHEYGAYCCSLPDLSLIPRLRNAVVQPVTYRRVARYVREKGLEGVYPALYRSSLAMLRDAHKHFMERARLGLDSGYGGGENHGYAYWLGVDFWDSPEGCWDEGVLNQLWEPKPLLTETIRQYNGPTVLLTDVETGKRTFYGDEVREVGLLVSHFGPSPLRSATVRWEVRRGRRVVARGVFAGVRCGVGQRLAVGRLTIPPLRVVRPEALVLWATLLEGERAVARNSWTFCAYPRPVAPSEAAGVYSEAGPLPGARSIPTDQPLPEDARIVFTQRVSQKRHGHLLARPGTAVVLVQTDQFRGTGEEMWPGTYFLNGFGGAFGAIIRDHPVLRGIPHGGRLDPVMYGLVTHSRAYALDRLPAAFADGTAVLGLDLTAWVTVVKEPVRVTMFSEVVCPSGARLLLCGLDIQEDCPESRYVLSQLLQHLLSGEPAPRAGRLTEGLESLIGTATIYLNFDGDNGKGSSLHPECRVDGPVRFEGGRCIIGGEGQNARLEIPNPVGPGANWSVEFTIHDLDRLAAAVGTGKLVFGLQYTNHARGLYWRPGALWANAPAYPGRLAIGSAPDVWAHSLTDPSHAIPVPIPVPQRVTIKVVTDAEAGTCACYVAYGDDATTPRRRASRFTLAARMPYYSLDWNAAPGFIHIATTESVVPVAIDDVIIEGALGKSFGKPPAVAEGTP